MKYKLFFVLCSVILFVGIPSIVGAIPASRVAANAWQIRPSSISNDLNAVACPTDRLCYVVGGAPFIGGNGVILKTDNGGDTWVSQLIPVTNPLRGISCLTSNLCYVSGDGGALLKTINGGASWTRLGVGTPAADQYYWSIFAIDAANVIAVGNAGKIFRTTNSGATWGEMSSGTFNNLTGVYFANGAIGWAVGGGSLLKTINGGTNWYPMPSGSSNFWWTADAVTQDLVWLSGGTISKSTDGALSSTAQYSTPGVTFRGIDMIDANNGWAVGNSGYIRKTVNGGTAWTEETSPTTVILRDVACPSAGLCFAVGDDGVIIRRGTPPPASPLAPPPVPPPSPSPSGGGGTPPPVPPQVNINPAILQAIGTRLLEDTLTQTQKTSIERKRHWGTKRIRGLSLNPQILQNNQIDFDLFANVSLRGILTRRDEKPDGTKIWKGTIQGKTGSTIRLVQVGNKVAGTIRTRDGVFSIRPSLGGGYTIQEIDLAKFPEDFHIVTPSSGGARVTATATPPPSASVAPVEIDVLVGYTTDVLALYDGSHDAVWAVAINMIEDANEVLENSEIAIRLRWVRLLPLSVNESAISWNGSMQDALPYFSSTFRDGVMQLHSIREDDRADIVTVLVSELDDFCGIGYQMNEENESTFANLAYNVVNVDCIDTNTFMHEVGHNMGAGHNEEDQFSSNGGPLPPRYTYSYGYRSTQFDFRTIMAYKCEGVDGQDICPRIPYFSNPDLRYIGHPIGTENEADNARTLMLTRWVVRDFNGGDDGVGGGANAAQDIASSTNTSLHPRVLPGTLRYTLRNMGHAARSFFTFNSERRAELHIRYASEKLLEANELAVGGKHDEAAAHLSAFEKEAGKAEQATKKLLEKKGEAGKDVASKLLTSKLKQQVLLNAFANKAPEEKKERFEQVQEKQVEKIKEVIELLGEKEKSEDVIQQVVKNLSTGMQEKQAQIDVLIQAKEKLPEQAKKIGDVIEKALKSAEPTAPQKIEKIPDTSKIEPLPVMCARIFAPVCGVNDKSYGNTCEAEQAGVKIAYKGECKEKMEKTEIEKEVEVVKPTESLPTCAISKAFVCGKNGITYLNECFAKEAKVEVSYAGECTSATTLPASKGTVAPTPSAEILCTQQYDPVCGENGKTYSNSCTAKQSGVGVAYTGECKTVTPLPILITPPSVAPVVPPPAPTPIVPPSVALPQCSDGADNDKDGYIDLKDSGCTDAQDTDESTIIITPPVTPPPAPTTTPTPTPTPIVVPPSTTLPQCSDGVDNDKDGYIDLKDTGCIDAQDTDESTVIVTPPPAVPPPAPAPTPTPPPVVKVNSPTAKLTTSKGATSIIIVIGSSATLSWTTTDAASVMLDQGIGKVAATGTLVVKPAKTTTYVLTATNSVGTATASLTVTVK